ncbi:MAG: FAD-dependent oxidoreductase, partial [Burkholderiales bacterium]
ARLTLMTPSGPVTPVDLSRLNTRYPYVAFMPQARFLEFIAAEARQYPSFRLIMGASVEELIEENGAVCGVRYVSEQGKHELRALLTVGADGRFSRLRRMGHFEAIKTSPPMDVLWFRMSRRTDEAARSGGWIRRGHMLVMLERDTQWQIGYVIPKGTYQRLREGGLGELRKSIAETAPHLADRVDELTDWKQLSPLVVESDRLARWYRAGLLLIGDAAHIMSPVGGVGINYAIQDAVVTANVLSKAIKAGQLRVEDLAAVQRQREGPTRFIQSFQTAMQKRIVAGALDPGKEFRLSPGLKLFLGTPFLRDLPARWIAFGPRRVRLNG